MLKNNKSVDTKTKGTVTSQGKIEVIEVNMPGTQALKNFNIKLIEIKEKLKSEVQVNE